MNFMCENVTLCSYKCNIILLNKKNNIIHCLLLVEAKNFVFTKSDNKYFYYTRRCIMIINIFIIQEDV